VGDPAFYGVVVGGPAVGGFVVGGAVVVVGGATVWWFASARKWFTGPKQNLIEKAAHGEQTMPSTPND
jgi:hypothetical protein